MGEVYLAYDLQLHRSVALKLINQTSDEDRLRRFRNEARVISSLSHPNLLTLYDAGQFASLPFIVTEFVKGQSLRQRINESPITLIEALDIAVQIANGLRAAHELGVVHRDIKPENVMVLPDGYIKILDFGLAKLLTPPQLAAPSPQTSTVSVINTESGLIVGTISYMSPEQLRGRAIDQRTDIWSLGVVLYEMISHRRPFEGESLSDIVAAILERPAAPLNTYAPEVQALLDKALERALHKNREGRFQTANELADSLKQIRQEIEHGPKQTEPDPLASAPTSQTSPSDAPQAVPTNRVVDRVKTFFGRFKIEHLKWMGVALLLVATVALLVSQNSFKQVKPPVTRELRSPEKLNESLYNPSATISPDGRFYVYVYREPDGRESLRLGQINVAGWKILIPADNLSYRGMTFTPDGNWIYVLVFGLKSNTTSGTLFRITTLGNATENVLENVDSPVTFSPDGQSFAFLRALPEEGWDQLIVFNLAQNTERVLSERRRPAFYVTTLSRETPSWSPDGKFIATPAGATGSDGDFMSVVAINVATGEEKPLTSRRWLRVGSTHWLKDGNGLVVSAAESGTELYQLYKIAGDGDATLVLPDFNDYSNLSLSSDGRLLLAVAAEKRSGIFLMPTGRGNTGVSQLTNGDEDGLWGFSWTPADNLVYVSLESRNRDIWIKTNDDKRPPRQLTFDDAADYSPTVSPDGRYIVFVSNRTGVLQVWRMDMDGSNVKQLTFEGQAKSPQITKDGQWVIYSSGTVGRPSLWKVSIEGGSPTRVVEKLASWPAISPDGKWIACVTKDDALDQPMKLTVLSADDFSVHREFDMPAGVNTPEYSAVIRWKPNSSAFAYVRTQNGVSNIFVQSLLGKLTKETDFTADRIFWFDWTGDGKQLAIARGVSRYMVVMMEDF